jgi:hypothetical protein
MNMKSFNRVPLCARGLLVLGLLALASGCRTVPVVRHPEPSRPDERIEEAWQVVVRATSIGERREASRAFLLLVREQRTERELQVRGVLEQRVNTATKVLLVSREAPGLQVNVETFQTTANYSEAVRAAREILAALHRMDAHKVWDADEKMDIDARICDWEENLARERTLWAQGKTREAQTHATLYARKDVALAGTLLEGERRKGFNWKWMGYPRDNSEKIILSWSHARRAESATGVDLPVSAEARRILYGVQKRVSSKDREIFQNLPSLPGYDENPVFVKNVRVAADGSRNPDHPADLPDSGGSAIRLILPAGETGK